VVDDAFGKIVRAVNIALSAVRLSAPSVGPAGALGPTATTL
jgi:hypothetical protein